MKTILSIFSLFFLLAFTMDKPAYRIFDQKGKASSYEKLLKEAESADIILFGELHNNPISHWLQLELTKDLHNKAKSRLILGAEMFEADNQVVLDEYVKGLIKESNFTQEARLWNNYQTDYKPLVEFAKEVKIPFVASNIPRRYASMVAKGGFDSLKDVSDEAKNWIAPLPVTVDLELSAYKNMLAMMQHSGGQMKPENFVYAQAIKDATMAHFILKNWQKGKQFIHYNGAYHSDDFQGIMWYLKKQNPQLKIVTISTVEQENIETLAEESTEKANFIIATPSSMTKTY